MTTFIDTTSRLSAVKSAVKLLSVGLIIMCAKFIFQDDVIEAQGILASIGMVVIVICINVFLFYKLLLGANWVRILLLVGFVMAEVPFSLFAILEFSSNIPLTLLTIIGLAVDFYAIYILFTKPAAEWFNKKTPGEHPQ